MDRLLKPDKLETLPEDFNFRSNFKKISLVKGTLTLNPIAQKDVDEVSLDELSLDEKSVHGLNHHLQKSSRKWF